MKGRLVRLTVMVALLSAAAAGSSGAASTPSLNGSTGSPFSPGVPQSQAPPNSTPATPSLPSTTSTSSSDSGLSGTDAIAIAIGAIVVLTAISLFIWRDARRRAPVRRRAVAADATGRAGAKQRVKPRKLSPAERRRRKRGRARR